MRLEIHAGLKDNKLLLQTLLIQAKKMVLREVSLKGIVVNVVLLLAVGRATITDMASFVSISTMGI